MKTQIKFVTPAELDQNKPIDQYTTYLKKLHAKLGFEAVSSRLEILSLEWAEASGYYFEIKENTLVFTHVSIGGL